MPKLIGKPKWRRPTTQEISNEWDWEYSRHVLGSGSKHDAFPTKKEFIEAVKRGKLVKVDKTLDRKIDNRSRTTSIEDLEDLVSGYQFPRDINSIVKGMISGATFPTPIVMKNGNSYRVLGGNSRMDVAFILKTEPVVTILDTTGKRI